MTIGAIRSANAGFGGARASALVGEGSLRCRAVHGGWGFLASVESGLCIHKAPSKKIPNS